MHACMMMHADFLHVIDSFVLIYMLKTRLTICEGRDGTETSNGDVLIFPDMTRYRFVCCNILPGF